MYDLISVFTLKEWIENWFTMNRFYHPHAKNNNIPITELYDILERIPRTHSTIYGYNIAHLELIARILRKQGLSPERVEEALTDISSIIAMVRDEYEDSLRKALEQCMR